ncbi:MAG: hypothetical protein ACFE9S_15640 [Candidatus Hermodarchaeota archaeon]
MGKLRIKDRKIVKQGDSHFVYIPRAYFNNEQLKVDEIYEIIIFPQKKTNKDSNTNNQVETAMEESN